MLFLCIGWAQFADKLFSSTKTKTQRLVQRLMLVWSVGASLFKDIKTKTKTGAKTAFVFVLASGGIKDWCEDLHKQTKLTSYDPVLQGL